MSGFAMLTAKTSFHLKRLSRMTRILVFWVSFCAEIITSAFANTKNAPSVELHLHEEDVKQDASIRYL